MNPTVEDGPFIAQGHHELRGDTVPGAGQGLTAHNLFPQQWLWCPF